MVKKSLSNRIICFPALFDCVYHGKCSKKEKQRNCRILGFMRFGDERTGLDSQVIRHRFVQFSGRCQATARYRILKRADEVEFVVASDHLFTFSFFPVLTSLSCERDSFC